MSQGQLFGPESNVFQDEATGVTIRQVTDHPSVHHHPFYYLTAWDDAMARLVFVSHRTGRREIFAELRDSRHLVQLTEQEGIHEWSVRPSHDGRYVYYTAGAGAWREATETFKAERLMSLGQVVIWEKGMAATAGGTTKVYAPQHTRPHPSFSPDGRRVCFTSDRTGFAQVYEATVPENWSDVLPGPPGAGGR